MIGASLGASLGEISAISDAFANQSLLKRRMNTSANTGGDSQKNSIAKI